MDCALISQLKTNINSKATYECLRHFQHGSPVNLQYIMVWMASIQPSTGPQLLNLSLYVTGCSYSE